MMNPGTAVVCSNILLTAIAFHFAPLVRKRSLFFGVTVEDAFRQTDLAREISRTYRLLIWSSAAAALLFVFIWNSSGWARSSAAVPLAMAAAGVAAWVMAWRRTRPHTAAPRAAERTATLSGPSPGLPGGLAAILLPFLGPIASIAYLWSRYDELPDPYPVHWDLAGHADRIARKSAVAVFFPPVMCALVLLLMAVFVVGIHYGARRGTSGEQPGWSDRHRRLNLVLLVNLMWILSALLSVTSFGALIPASTMRFLFLSCLVLLLIVVVGLTVRMYRMSMEATGGTDATPEECWRWGSFYYNADDPALLVEKRSGPGFTLNFGNRLSWAVLVLIAIITFAPVVLTVR